MGVQLANPTVSVNNDAVSIMPNSLRFTEGLGEQTTRAASGGGGNVEQIYSENIETNFGKVMFDIPATVGNIALAREWKANGNQNLVQIAGRTPEGTVTRTFTQAALLNDYEVALGADTVISLEFTSNQAI
jgi:hypothetical protein